MAKEVATVQDILNKFNNRKAYQDLDRRALDISRKANAGNLGEGEYADWALISNDPLVMINSVKTFITVLQARLSSSPFRPENNDLKQMGQELRFNSLFTKIYGDVLADGYAYVSIGIQDNIPIVVPVDARYILFVGDDPTLKDSKDVVVFNIISKGISDDSDDKGISVKTEFVTYDEQKERIEVSYYHIDSDGVVHLDIYDSDEEPRESYTLEGITRIPVVRFVGDEVELEDKRPHYRGVYHLVASVLKAMTLAATKIQINTAAHDDDNWVASYDAISNHMGLWQNQGVKPIDTVDQNGNPINPPTQITKGHEFLINAYNTWKTAIDSMLGHLIVESKSEAITEQEVMARNEIRDAITSAYMTKMADSISAVYTIIQGLMMKGEKPVVVVGGFLEEVKRNKEREELMRIYGLAKESGLNTQGFAYELLNLSDMQPDVKSRIQQTFAVAPNNNPQTVELQNQIKQLQQQSQMEVFKKDQIIAALKTQVNLRTERQASYVAMKEREFRTKVTLEQWKQEARDAQQGRIEVLKSYSVLMKESLEAGNKINADYYNNLMLQVLNSTESRDSLLLAQRKVDEMISEADENYVAFTNKPPIANDTNLVRDPEVEMPQQVSNNPPLGVPPNGTQP